jgi:copper transporter 1
MLFNTYTIDACFFTNWWQITSATMFAGSCIGVVALVVAVEAIGRFIRDYDRSLFDKHDQVSHALQNAAKGTAQPAIELVDLQAAPGPPAGLGMRARPYRPTWKQQMVRALLRTVHWAGHMLIMLLAMYFNLWFLLCMLIGTFIGKCLFEWETVVAKSPPGWLWKQFNPCAIQ